MVSRQCAYLEKFEAYFLKYTTQNFRVSFERSIDTSFCCVINVHCYLKGVCEPNPCDNGGTCSIAGGGGWTCSCPPGWTGSQCQNRELIFRHFMVYFLNIL